MEKKESINVFGKKLDVCCNNPKTGFFRNGSCDTCNEAVSYTHLTLPTNREV